MNNFRLLSCIILVAVFCFMKYLSHTSLVQHLRHHFCHLILLLIVGSIVYNLVY